MIEIKTKKVEVSENTANWLNALAEVDKAFKVVLEAAAAQYGDDCDSLNKEIEETLYEPYEKLKLLICGYMACDFLEDATVVNKFQASLTA